MRATHMRHTTVISRALPIALALAAFALLAPGPARAADLDVWAEAPAALPVGRPQNMTVRVSGSGPVDVSVSIARTEAVGSQASVVIGSAEQVAPGANHELEITVPRRVIGARLSAAARIVVTVRPAGAGAASRGRRAVVGTTLVRPISAHLWLDKPLYQAGETVRVRALVVDATTGAALPGERVSLVHDAPAGGGRAGARLGSAERTTDEWGIVSAEFPLSDEVATGAHAIGLLHRSGESLSSAAAAVSRYALPPFKARLELDRGFYLPDDLIRGRLVAAYPDGRPVAEAAVTIAFRSTDTEVSLGTLAAKTDADGVLVFDRRVPSAPFAGLFGIDRATLVVEAQVTDPAGAIRGASAVTRLALEPLAVRLLPEVAGGLVSGVENRIHVEVTGPAGNPIADAAVRITVDGATKILGGAEPQAGEGTTDALGLVSFRVHPEAIEERDEELSVIVEAVAPSGARIREESASLPLKRRYDGLIVRPERFVVAAGSPVRARILDPMDGGRIVVTLRRGQVVVSRVVVDQRGGSRTVELPVPADVAGELVLDAVDANSHRRAAARRILVRGERAIEVTLSADRARYLPGETGKLSVETTRDGKPVPAAVGIAIVDERLFALRERSGASAFARFTLSPELAASPLTAAALASFRDGTAPVPDEIAARLERAVEGLGALHVAIPRGPVSGDSSQVDLSAARAQLRRLRDGIESNRGYVEWGGEWGEPLRWLVDHGGVAESELVDPWGGPIRFEERGWIFSDWFVESDGPDGVKETEDDLVYEIR